VFVFDSLIYGNYLPHNISVKDIDICKISPDMLSGFDAVIHLAACSDELHASKDPHWAEYVNVQGTKRLVECCRKAGIGRFIYASTCSVYGHQPDKVVTETVSVSPVGQYGITKWEAEQIVSEAMDNNFRPIILRIATLHGWTERYRDDLVVNKMIKTALTEGVIRIIDEKCWRPLLHVNDAAFAYLTALKASESGSVVGIFNICFDNYTIPRIAEDVRSALADHNIHTSIETIRKDVIGSYRVDSAKFCSTFGWHPQITVGESVKHTLVQIRG